MEQIANYDPAKIDDTDYTGGPHKAVYQYRWTSQSCVPVQVDLTKLCTGTGGPHKAVCQYRWTSQSCVLVQVDLTKLCASTGGPHKAVYRYRWTSQSCVPVQVDLTKLCTSTGGPHKAMCRYANHTEDQYTRQSTQSMYVWQRNYNAII